MISIEKNRILYTKNDTFEISVSIANGFASGSYLNFVIAKNEKLDAIISTTHQLNEEGKFVIFLTQSEIDKLAYDDYVYKITIFTPDAKIVTYKSGELIVKWGA